MERTSVHSCCVETCVGGRTEISKQMEGVQRRQVLWLFSFLRIKLCIFILLFLCLTWCTMLDYNANSIWKSFSEIRKMPRKLQIAFSWASFIFQKNIFQMLLAISSSLATTKLFFLKIQKNINHKKCLHCTPPPPPPPPRLYLIHSSLYFKRSALAVIC